MSIPTNRSNATRTATSLIARSRQASRNPCNAEEFEILFDIQLRESALHAQLHKVEDSEAWQEIVQELNAITHAAQTARVRIYGVLELDAERRKSRDHLRSLMRNAKLQVPAALRKQVPYCAA